MSYTDLSELDPRVIAALLSWQAEAGIDEAIDEDPLDRFAQHQAEQEARAARVTAPPQAGQAPQSERRGAPPRPEPEAPPKIDPAAEARKAAAAATTPEALSAALRGFAHLDLHRGARSYLFAEGVPSARVMIVTDAPGREADREGQLFPGPQGVLLDRMLAAIGLERGSDEAAKSVYVAPLSPWPTPGNRAPEPAEVDCLLPFLRRHIALSGAEVVLVMGNQPSQALLSKTGILSLRGSWSEVMGRPALITLPPQMLLQNPYLKAGSWADLLELQARLRK